MTRPNPGVSGEELPVLTATYATGRGSTVPSARSITRIFPLGDEGERILLAVADGIGDRPSAEVQAAEALAQLETTVARSGAGVPAEEVLKAGYESAANAIDRLKSLPGSVSGSGAAMVAALVHDGVATIGNLGRGAAYLLRGGSAHRLTADNRWGAGTAALQPPDPEATLEIGERVPLGAGGPTAPDITGPLPLQPGDTLLLCSESVTRGLGPKVVTAVFEEAGPSDVAQQLADLASHQPDVDGAAVALLHFPADAAPVVVPPIPRTGRRPRWLIAAVLTGAIAAGAVLAGSIYYAATRGNGGSKPAATAAARGAVSSPTPALPAVVVPASPTGRAAASVGTATAPRPPTPFASPTPIVVANLPVCVGTGSQPSCRYTAQPGDSISRIGDRFDLTSICFVAANAQHQPVAPRPPDFRIGAGEDYALLSPGDCAALAAATPAAGAPSASATTAAPAAAATTPLPVCTPRPGATAPNPLC